MYDHFLWCICLVCVGCGNSLLPIKMYEDGFHNIVNVDYSAVVIDKMRSRWSHLTGMEWIVADIHDLTPLPQFSYDVVIEKGNIDAMLVSEKNPWKVSPSGEQTIDLVLTQVSYMYNRGIFFVFHQICSKMKKSNT